MLSPRSFDHTERSVGKVASDQTVAKLCRLPTADGAALARGASKKDLGVRRSAL
jgi:hypothetical protein